MKPSKLAIPDPLWGETIGDREIPVTKATNVESVSISWYRHDRPTFQSSVLNHRLLLESFVTTLFTHDTYLIVYVKMVLCINNVLRSVLITGLVKNLFFEIFKFVHGVANTRSICTTISLLNQYWNDSLKFRLDTNRCSRRYSRL